MCPGLCLILLLFFLSEQQFSPCSPLVVSLWRIGVSVETRYQDSNRAGDVCSSVGRCLSSIYKALGYVVVYGCNLSTWKSKAKGSGFGVIFPTNSVFKSVRATSDHVWKKKGQKKTKDGNNFGRMKIHAIFQIWVENKCPLFSIPGLKKNNYSAGRTSFEIRMCNK